MISVIIPSYKSCDFLKECLESVLSQDYFVNNDFEILVGFDAAEKIGDIRKPIEHEKIRYFYSENRNYPYLIRNTLWKKSKGDKLFFFDADDIMTDGMMTKLVGCGGKVCRYWFNEFTDGFKDRVRERRMAHFGSFLCDRDMMDITGGFRGWKCAADREWMTRIARYGYAWNELHEFVSLRRVHGNALTVHKDTRMGSELRKQYWSMIKEDDPLKTETETCEMFEI